MTKSLKIVHLLASSKWTGPAEGVVTLCRDLKHQGHDIRFYCNLLERRLLADRAVERGVTPLEGLRLNTKNPVTIGWDVHRLKNILQEERPDILHLHLSTDHWIGALSVRWASLATRVIRTIHHPNTLRPIPFRRGLYESMTHGFVTLSEKDRQYLTRFYRIEPNPVAVIHGAVDTARFHPDHDPRPIRAEFGIGPATPVIGMVARFQPHRRHKDMIQAMVTLRRLIPPARLILVGKGEYRPVLEQFVRKLGLEHHVFFAGYRDQDLPQV